MYDVVIIGGGVVGCSIARELSRYRLKICLLEKCPDVAEGTSKANSAIIHAGFDAKPGSLKAKLNVAGNAMFDKLAKELDLNFKRNGSLVVCFSQEDMPRLEKLAESGRANGVSGLAILDAGQVRRLEPNLSEHVAAALYAPSGAIICPYEFTIALAENAQANGVEFRLNEKVVSIKKNGGSFKIGTVSGAEYAASVVINAAGLFSDELNNMVSAEKISIVPRKGEYCLFDKTVGDLLGRTVFQLPTKLGKGALVTPTVDGNLLVGPSAVDQQDRADMATTSEGLDFILAKAALTLSSVPFKQVITSFAGLRAHCEADDFIIGEAPDVENLINVAGIESPGLSSAPAIGEMVAGLVTARLSLAANEGFDPVRVGIPRFRDMDNEERSRMISTNPAYGRIICRCETVTEGEIIDAIRRPLGARSLDGVKRRTRAGMGRCQSGFCMGRVTEILSRELGLPYTGITKSGHESYILAGRNKEL